MRQTSTHKYLALIARGLADPFLIPDGPHAPVAKPDARFLGQAEVADIARPTGCRKDARKRVTAPVRDDHLDLAAAELVDVVLRDAVVSAAGGIPGRTSTTLDGS